MTARLQDGPFLLRKTVMASHSFFKALAPWKEILRLSVVLVSALSRKLTWRSGRGSVEKGDSWLRE